MSAVKYYGGSGGYNPSVEPAREGSGADAAGGGRFTPGIHGWGADFFANYPPGVGQQNLTHAVNVSRLCRFRMPRAGVLSGIWVYIVTLTAASTMRYVIYDAGEALSGSYSLIDSGALVSMDAVGWKRLGNPSMDVEADQDLFIGQQWGGTAGAAIAAGPATSIGGNGVNLPSDGPTTDPGLTLRTGFSRNAAGPPATISEADAAASGISWHPLILVAIEDS